MMSEEMLYLYAMLGCKVYKEEKEKSLKRYKDLDYEVFVELTQKLIDDTEEDEIEICNKLREIDNETK